MSVIRVGDTVYLQIKTASFVWEPAWDRYRPVTSVSWDGDRIVLDDRAYCSDPTDPLYGYGTPAMQDLCGLLSQRHPPSTARAAPLPAIGPAEWFFDRYASLTPCAPRDRASWKRFHKGRYRTPQSAPKTRLTRRSPAVKI
jgi:hypothetical protein